MSIKFIFSCKVQGKSVTKNTKNSCIFTSISQNINVSVKDDDDDDEIIDSGF